MSVASKPSEACMQRAIEIARRGMAAGEPPIGACLVRDGEVIATAHNSVVSALDITAHAEIMVISFDILLVNLVVDALYG